MDAITIAISIDGQIPKRYVVPVDAWVKLVIQGTHFHQEELVYPEK